MLPTNTGIFLRSLNLCGENRTWQALLVSKKKVGRNRTVHFSEIIKPQHGKINAIHYFVFLITAFLNHCYPHGQFAIKICFSHIVINRAKILLY